jgi:hypothetical protein
MKILIALLFREEKGHPMWIGSLLERKEVSCGFRTIITGKITIKYHHFHPWTDMLKQIILRHGQV